MSKKITWGQINPAPLRKTMESAFIDDHAVRTLCHDLNIGYDDIRGETRPEKILGILHHCKRYDRFDELLRYCLHTHPNKNWNQCVTNPEILFDLPVENAPYKGLNYFDESDTDLFFGREKIIKELLEKLEVTNFISIVGISGSGKSSIVRAGLIPILRRNKLADLHYQPINYSEHWSIHVITPSDDPLRELAITLAKIKEASSREVSSLIKNLQNDPQTLDLFIRLHTSETSSASHNSRVLLIIDQFEELFTLCKNNGKRDAFIDNLLTATSSDIIGPIQVITVLRSDFYNYWTEHPELSSRPTEHQINIASMTSEELRQAIEEPAKRNGLQIEPELVNILLREMPNKNGLPLLSHVLLEIWKNREGNKLTVRGYYKTGGIEKALSHTANNTLEHFDSESQELVHNIFLRLVEPREDLLEVRRIALVDDLIPVGQKHAVVQKILVELAGSHLLTVENNKVQISHEALIGHWERLRQWLGKDKEALFIQTRLIDTVKQWKQHNKDKSFLVSGNQLQLYKQWAKDHAPTKLEAEFIEKSNIEEEYKIAQINRAAQLETIQRYLKRASIFIAVLFAALFVISAIFKIPPFSPSWHMITPILGGSTWNILTVPDQPNIVYVGNADKGVYKSYDGGNTWTAANTGIADKQVAFMVADPQSSNRIYGTAEVEGIVMTTDAGENWQQINAGLPANAIVTALAISEYPTTTLYTSLWGYGVWTTPANKIKWEKISGNGLPNEAIHELEVIPDSQSEMIVSVSHEGLYKSNDSGNTWEFIAFEKQDITRIDVVPWNKDFLFIREALTGPYISLDKGMSWDPLSNNINNYTARSFSYDLNNDPPYLFIGTKNGEVFQSTEESLQHWESVWSNLPSALIRDIEIPFADTVLISTNQGVYISKDNGNTWVLTGPEILPANSIVVLTDQTKDIHNLIVATDVGIYQNSDLLAEYWDTINGGLYSLETMKLFVSQPDEQEVCLILADGNLYCLSENKAKWELLKIPSGERVISVAIFNKSGLSTFYIGTEKNNLYVNSSHNSPWTLLWQAPNNITKIIATDNIIYLGTYGNGIYKSTDSGSTWVPINNGITSPYVNDLDIAENNILYAATEDGVFTSYDAGETWKPSATGLQNRKIDVISVHPKYSGIVYAGALDGLYYSIDYGKSWKTLEKGLETKDIRDIFMTMNNVLVGTGTGVYYMKHPVTPLALWYELRFQNTSP